MELDRWVPLFEYSNQHRISVSTLRRRIKNKEIVFKLDHGKYYILDAEHESVEKPRELAPAQVSIQPVKTTNAPVSAPATPSNDVVFSSANQLLSEIKRAYTLILQEKDEQVRMLREEIADLRTLVRVLENQLEETNRR